VTRTPPQGQKVKGQRVADVLKGQHAGTGATWQINTKILSTCRWRRHIVAAARLQLITLKDAQCRNNWRRKVMGQPAKLDSPRKMAGLQDSIMWLDIGRMRCDKTVSKWWKTNKITRNCQTKTCCSLCRRHYLVQARTTFCFYRTTLCVSAVFAVTWFLSVHLSRWCISSNSEFI